MLNRAHITVSDLVIFLLLLSITPSFGYTNHSLLLLGRKKYVYDCQGNIRLQQVYKV